MNIKKEVVEILTSKLERQLKEIQFKIHRNKWEITKLGISQRLLKEERREVGDLIHYLNAKNENR